MLVLSSAAVANADSSTRTVQVTAQVVARAIVTVDRQPASIDVTEADIARGYLDVPTPLQWRGQTNSRRGYLLQVTNESDVFSAVNLAFAGTEMNVGQQSWVARPYVPGGESLTVQVRLILRASTQPGRHLLPISVSATPL